MPSSQSIETMSCQDTLTSAAVTVNVSDSLTRRSSRLIPKGTFRVRSTTANTTSDKVVLEPINNLINTGTGSKKFIPTTSNNIQNEIEQQVVPIPTLSEQIIGKYSIY